MPLAGPSSRCWYCVGLVFTCRFPSGGYIREASGKPPGLSSEAERARASILGHLFPGVWIWAPHWNPPPHSWPVQGSVAMSTLYGCRTSRGHDTRRAYSRPRCTLSVPTMVPDIQHVLSLPAIPCTRTTSRELGHVTLPHPAPTEPAECTCPEGSRPWLWLRASERWERKKSHRGRDRPIGFFLLWSWNQKLYEPQGIRSWSKGERMCSSKPRVREMKRREQGSLWGGGRAEGSLCGEWVQRKCWRPCSTMVPALPEAWPGPALPWSPWGSPMGNQRAASSTRDTFAPRSHEACGETVWLEELGWRACSQHPVKRGHGGCCHPATHRAGSP